MIERQRRAANARRHVSQQLFRNGTLGMHSQSRAVRADGPPIRFPPSDLWQLA
jgi:hypothetical protein